MWASMGGCVVVVVVLWSCLALGFLLAFLIHNISPRLPSKYERSPLRAFLRDLIRYGKTKQRNRDDWLRVFDVPKRWFWHFYAVSVVWTGLLLVLSLQVALQGQPYPQWLTSSLSFLCGVQWDESRAPQVSTLLVQLLLWGHSLRRLLECLLVSVYSQGVIHVAQYVFGMGYYVILGLTVLCCDNLNDAKGVDSLFHQLDLGHLSGAALFIWASLLQHSSLVTLARLRTGSSGAAKTFDHGVPHGGWFELVSCPHYFAELLIYVSLGLVLGGLSLTWWTVVSYVLFNQAVAAQLCQEYYMKKFECYPRRRCAFIPFVL
ncbi:Polyprenol reductase [Merluccius polli]|uniref:Polyprenal reductase n=1 Tax=Merluccius polli TaxID=89951 RepID=A0AA47MPD4_MERPO|nr:Polyprenol reductase [Merluccius polli]